MHHMRREKELQVDVQRSVPDRLSTFASARFAPVLILSTACVQVALMTSLVNILAQHSR